MLQDRNLNWKGVCMNNRNVRVSHFTAWNIVPDELIENFMAEFAAAGAEYITLMSRQLIQMLGEPEYAVRLGSQMKKLKLKTADAHGLAGPDYDLDIPGRREGIIADHKRALEYCAEFGVETYTVHVGAAPWCRRPDPFDFDVLRPNALDTLEKILPVAEKLGIVLAVENSFEPVNSPDEVIGYIRHFNSPYIRCCYDSGHANYMAGRNKDPSRYKDSFHEIVWRGKIVFEDRAVEKLSPYIVTCHLHDNSGYGDDHVLPGTASGTIDWKTLMPKLLACPDLRSIQNESNFATQHVPVQEVCRIFNKISAMK